MSAKDAVLLPPARPDLPILIAAKRPRMLDLTARHADAWNLAWFGWPDERLAKARADLAAACDAAGRDRSTLEITVGVNVRFDDLLPSPGSSGSPASAAITGTVADIAGGFAAHAALGAGHLIVAAEPTTPEAVRRVAEAARLARAQRTETANLERSGS